ncbi:hypothetical protein CWI39_2722p0010, partial [Hamiltosporidium magnivora]
MNNNIIYEISKYVDTSILIPNKKIYECINSKEIRCRRIEMNKNVLKKKMELRQSLFILKFKNILRDRKDVIDFNKIHNIICKVINDK